MCVNINLDIIRVLVSGVIAFDIVDIDGELVLDIIDFVSGHG